MKQEDVLKEKMEKENEENESNASMSTAAPLEDSYYSRLTRGAYTLWASFPTAVTGIIKGFPHFKGNLFLGQLRSDLGEGGLLIIMEEADEFARRYPEGACSLSLGDTGIYCADPELIRKLKTEHDDKLGPDLRIFETFKFFNILTYPHHIWKPMREVFTDGVKVSQYQSKMREIASKHLEILSQHLQKSADETKDDKKSEDEKVNLDDFFISYVMDIITRTLMGVEDNDQKTLEKMKSFFKTLTEKVFNFKGLIKCSLNSKLLRDLIFWGENNDLVKFKEEIVEAFNETFKFEKVEENTSKTLLNLLVKKLSELASTNPQKSAADEEELSQGIFLIIAGAVSTVATLLFVTKLLNANPDVKKKLHEELSKALGDRDVKTLTLEEINKLKYLDCIIKESLRLYPPVPVMPPPKTKKPIEISITRDDVEINLQIPEGVNIIMSPWALHRAEKLWGKDVDKFMPERFEKISITPDFYMPFGMGPHMCPGKPFAYLDVKLMVIGMLLRVPEFELTDKVDPNNPNKFEVTLARGGLFPKNTTEMRTTPGSSMKEEKESGAKNDSQSYCTLS